MAMKTLIATTVSSREIGLKRREEGMTMSSPAKEAAETSSKMLTETSQHA